MDQTTIESDYTAPFSNADLRKLQDTDSSLAKMWEAAKDPLQTIFTVKQDILYQVNMDPKKNGSHYRIVVPVSLRPKVLQVGHACSGHFGAKKTKAQIESHFYWPGLAKDIADHCKACTVCAAYNSHKPDIQPLKPVPLVHTPWQKLAMDIVGPFSRTSNGYQYILTLVDMATRFPEAISLKRVDTASTAEALLRVFSAYGTPQTIVLHKP